ncbi:ABC transporter substrate-binding protein [Georgenia daeguensis]|uniref:SsuA/THI5-like domain-containing protein n=1 Tax=Georgenia daeguensis TaxID=908355 RepID=A0ABP8EW23_9MICO
MKIQLGRRRRPLIATGMVPLLIALAACGGDDGGAEPGGGGGTGGGAGGGTTTLRVAMPTSTTSFANSDVAVADEMGYFDEVGLAVEISNLKSGSSVTTGVVGGQFEVGGSSIEPVINAFAGGGEVKVIASYTDRLEVEMVVPEDIESPEDLKGKPVGIQEVGAFREVMTRMVLEDAGLTAKDVQYVSVNANAYIGALLQGQISSAILHPEQAIEATNKDDTLHPLVNLYEVEPDYFYGVYFVDAGWLEENQDAAEGFAEAITKAHRTMYDDREAVVPIIAEATGFDEKVIDGAWETYMEEVQAYPKNVGLEEDRLQYTVERMQELGTLRAGEAPDVAEMVDRGPMEAAVEKLGEVEERS